MYLKKILLIDDDENICRLMAEAVKKVGFDSRCLSNIDNLKSDLVEYDPGLIILDLNIPGCDGIEMLRHFSEQNCKVPIIIISGHNEKIRATAFNLGRKYGLEMLAHFQKPVSLKLLTETLENYTFQSIEPTIENLKYGILNNEMLIHYQPMVSLSSFKVIALEVLVRWNFKQKKIVYPDAFILFCEENGLIQSLTDWIIERVFQQLSALESRFQALPVSINLSSCILNHLELADKISELSKKYNIRPENVCFEVTETGVMSQPQIAMDILTRLRLKGFKISIDDFGTGYSSLVELHLLPFSEMKVDKSFVMNLLKDQQAFKITKSIIDLGHNLELDIVAEGIENEEVFYRLKEMGCDVAQGYYISVPMDLDNTIQWLKTQPPIPLKRQ